MSRAYLIRIVSVNCSLGCEIAKPRSVDRVAIEKPKGQSVSAGDEAKGALIRAARTLAGLSQRELGERMRPRLSEQSIYKLESGRQRITGVIALDLAGLLNIDPASVSQDPLPADRAAAARPAAYIPPPLDPVAVRYGVLTMIEIWRDRDYARNLAARGAQIDALVEQVIAMTEFDGEGDTAEQHVNRLTQSLATAVLVNLPQSHRQKGRALHEELRPYRYYGANASGFESAYAPNFPACRQRPETATPSRR